MLRMHPDEVVWEPFPMAAEQLVDGAPDAQVHWLFRSPPGQRPYWTGLWRVQPSTFRWHFLVHETAHVLAGRVRIVAEDGTVMELRAGDVAHFVKGARTVWEVTEPLTKFFVEAG
jgi:uncharacterized cupin superfamily protein